MNFGLTKIIFRKGRQDESLVIQTISHQSTMHNFRLESALFLSSV